jgi:5-bromo-4-chloroindolyl phosphate hydrolysis protein
MRGFRGIAAGASGAGVLLIFQFALHTSFLLSLGAGVAVMVGVGLIGRTKTDSTSFDQVLDGATDDFYKRTIEEGRVHARAIKGYLPQIEEPGVQAKVRRIADISDRIFEVLESKPQSVKVIRQYFTYYLEATSKIVGKYAELKKQRLKDAEVEEIIARTESHLDMIGDLFEQKLKKLVSDDVLDLDIELDLLQKMLKSEGLQ